MLFQRSCLPTCPNSEQSKYASSIMKTRPKIQQNVARSYLHGFATGAGRQARIWAYLRNRTKRFLQKPDTAARQTNFYSIQRADGGWDDSIKAGSAEFGHFKLCGSWYGNRRKAAEFLRSETLRYLPARRGARSTLSRNRSPAPAGQSCAPVGGPALFPAPPPQTGKRIPWPLAELPSGSFIS